MSARVLATVFCALLCLPAAAAAGPIEFTLGVSNLTTSSGAPPLGMALVPGNIPNQPLTAGDGMPPAGADIVLYEPWRLPTPAPQDIQPDGTARWDGGVNFSVDVLLTDVASGQSATLTFHGGAQLYNTYSTEQGWVGNSFIGFAERPEVALGGNNYTLIGADRFFGGDGGLNIWVGTAAPEPGTFALAALGLAPLGLRRLRRVW